MEAVYRTSQLTEGTPGAWLVVLHAGPRPGPVTWDDTPEPVESAAAQEPVPVWLVVTHRGEELVLTPELLDALNGVALVAFPGEPRIRLFAHADERSAVTELLAVDVGGRIAGQADYEARQQILRAADGQKLLLIADLMPGEPPPSWPRGGGRRAGLVGTRTGTIEWVAGQLGAGYPLGLQSLAGNCRPVIP